MKQYLDIPTAYRQVLDNTLKGTCGVRFDNRNVFSFTRS